MNLLYRVGLLFALWPYPSVCLVQVQALSASLSELSESRKASERRAAAAEDKLRIFLIRTGSRPDDSFSEGTRTPSAGSARLERSAVFESELKSTSIDADVKELAKMASYKSSKSEEIRKLTSALEVARARGEALARELASARQEHDAFVSCDGLLLRRGVLLLMRVVALVVSSEV